MRTQAEVLGELANAQGSLLYVKNQQVEALEKLSNMERGSDEWKTQFDHLAYLRRTSEDYLRRIGVLDWILGRSDTLTW